MLLRDVGERDEADFAFFFELREGADGFIEGNDGIGNVELIDVNAIEAKALEAALDGFAEMSGGGVVSPLIGAGTLPSSFGGDDEASGIGMQRLGDELFADVRAIRVGGVYEVDAEFDGVADDGDCGFAVVGGSPDAFAGDAHGAEAETIDGELSAE
jgi:hypothetical protein